jgi:protease-4
MREGPHSDVFSELGLGPKAISLWDLRRALRHAADDENVAGLFVEVAEPQMGFAQLREVTEEIRRFGTKKPVHVLLESDSIGDGGYYAATAGTKIWAAPTALWAVNGLSADVMFFRGTLDKLHVEPHILTFKEYKNAGEPFSRYEMSDYFREAITDVVGDIQAEWYRDVAMRRKVDESKIRLAVDRGLMTSAQAQETGLVDALGYRDEVEEALRQVAGTEEYESMELSKYADDVDDSG